MSTAPLEERRAADLAHALDLPAGDLDLKIIQDALPRIRNVVNREIDAQAPKTKHRLANDKRYGAFYGTERAMEALAVRTRQQLSDRIGRHTVLRVKLEGGHVNAFPAFQFRNREVIPELKKVLKILLPVVATEWTVLRWLTLRLPELHDQRPIDVLRGEAELEVPMNLVLEAARGAAQVWGR